jgi:hypothetical protein
MRIDGARVALPAERPLTAAARARSLFAPLAGLYPLSADTPLGLEELNGLLRRAPRWPYSGGGYAIRFVPASTECDSYEQSVYRSGDIPTRPNWHDFFNALVWLRFPRTKAALNALHVEAPVETSGRRGPLRDAATQFDESGLLVAASDPSLLRLLEARAWKELFWARRAQVVARMRFVVFGHGLYEALRAPFYRICGRTALVHVGQDCIDAPVEQQCAELDRVLAARFESRAWYLRPKVLLALPLLGIPGVCRDNEHAEYYDDLVQFRPPPA